MPASRPGVRHNRIMRSVLLLILFAAPAPGALMPLPWKMVPGPGEMPIDSSIRFANTGCPEFLLIRFQSLVARHTRPARTRTSRVMAIHCIEPAPPWPTLGEDESYVLDVTPETLRLDAQTATGAMRGMATLSQLIVPRAEGFAVPAVHIEDRPRFPWRGLMLDVSRHWMPVAVVERNLEAMAAVKLNVFHWHLSDDQGFRVESKLFPRLHQLGSDGNFYTQDQIREIVAYARDRGIRVIPEFDMPGHTTSWFVGLPGLAAAPGPYSIARTWGVFPAVMNAASEATYAFLDSFFGEMAALFPDPYFHIGGDEVADPAAQLLQVQFNLRVQSLLRQRGKTMIGWEELLGPGLEASAVIQSWRGTDALASAARLGHPAILSYGYYLDYLQPASYHYSVDPGQTPGVLGGEACMWAEYVSQETVDSRIWPRMAAIAERFWSSAEVRSVDSLYARLEPVSRWLEAAGIQHRAAYLPMLQRLAAGQPVEPAQVLADASEAAGIDVRRTRPYSSLTPLDRFVDAARPESEFIHALEQDIALLIAGDATRLPRLRSAFQDWTENHARLEPLLSGVSLLAEVLPLSQNLKTVGDIGTEALRYWEAGRPAPADWIARQNQTLDQLQRPVAEVILAAVRPVRQLLNAPAR